MAAAYFPRTLTTTIRRALRTFPAVIVTGARQTGKTTLLREEFGATHRYVSLERPDVREVARDDPTGFVADAGPRAILDEIQYVPELLNYVKEAIDENRRPGSWLLTGSQDFTLMRGVSQTLAGRVAVLHLDPLSVAEIAAARSTPTLARLVAGRAIRTVAPPPDLGDWLHRGGYPEPRLNRRVDRDLWMQSYVQTYLERDLRNLEQVSDLETFRAFFALTCASTGQVLNLARLGRDAGVTGPTAKRWLNLLVASRLVALLPPYHRNFGKRIRKSPKLHLVDPGLASWMLGYRTVDAILQGPALGALTESAVVAELLKAAHNGGSPPRLFHWQSASLEVDIVADIDGRLYGIEVKATRTPTLRHADHLARWCELTGGSGLLACRTDRVRSLGKGIRAVPWHFCVAAG
ncbi:MAG: ATP-binding protein [Acidobacteria bacterium]|nr:ATP-binding protein [Acidobacteriota bacterium]